MTKNRDAERIYDAAMAAAVRTYEEAIAEPSRTYEEAINEAYRIYKETIRMPVPQSPVPQPTATGDWYKRYGGELR